MLRGKMTTYPNGQVDKIFIVATMIKVDLFKGRKAPSIKFISQFIAIAPVENKQ